MKVKTSGLGLIVLGILLLGAQLVLYLGVKNARSEPTGTGTQVDLEHRNTLVPAVLGGIALVAGLALVAKKSEQADDPRDGRSIPEEPVEASHRKAS